MAPNLKTNKFVETMKKGFQDIKLVAQEGNYKLFAKQIVVVVIIFFVFKWASGKFNDKVNNYNGQMEAIRVQQTSEQEYMASKKKLLDLEPRFPDLADKNEWLISHIMDTFKAQKLTPSLDSAQKEDTTNGSYVVASLAVGVNTSFDNFANLLAALESKKEYVKLTQFDLAKETEPNNLGVNKITMTINTIFPKEKVAASIFKDNEVTGGN